MIDLTNDRWRHGQDGISRPLKEASVGFVYRGGPPPPLFSLPQGAGLNDANIRVPAFDFPKAVPEKLPPLASFLAVAAVGATIAKCSAAAHLTEGQVALCRPVEQRSPSAPPTRGVRPRLRVYRCSSRRGPFQPPTDGAAGWTLPAGPRRLPTAAVGNPNGRTRKAVTWRASASPELGTPGHPPRSSVANSLATGLTSRANTWRVGRGLACCCVRSAGRLQSHRRPAEMRNSRLASRPRAALAPSGRCRAACWS